MATYVFIGAHAREYPVHTMCRVLGVSRSGYYAWRARPEPERARQDRTMLVAIRASHEASGRTYGSPRVREDLRAEGRRVGRRRVARLMRSAGLRATAPRRFVATTAADPALPVAGNVLARDFAAAGPDEKWCADITYVPTHEGWLYVAVVVELFSRRVVGHAMGATLAWGLAGEALRLALSRRSPVAGLVHHSDRGSQYASSGYRALLASHGAVCSMSRRGDCWDNAPAESFFATLKKELVHRRVFATRGEARTAVFRWIEGYYNTRRRHSAIGYLSPAAFEEQHRMAMKMAA